MNKKKYALTKDMILRNMNTDENPKKKLYILNENIKKSKKLSFRIEEDQVRLLKIWCIKNDTNITKMLTEYIKSTVSSGY